MLLAVTNTKKMPRLFLAHGDEDFQPMNGLKVIWPDLAESQVFDLSFSGIAVSSLNRMSKYKLGANFEIKLRVFPEGLTLVMKVRLIRMTAKVIGFIFESISTEGRLVLDQVIKDRFVLENLRQTSTAALPPSMQSQVWVHGPFDTNFMIWKKESGELDQVIVEYDNLLWIYQQGRVTIQKSPSAVDEARGYLANPEALASTPGTVSMGASWLDRLLKLMDKAQAQLDSPDMKALQSLLRAQRSN